MRSLLIFSITVIFLSSFIVLESLQPENGIKKYIGNSVPFIGSEIPRMDGIDGTGIKIAVIDTGVDFNHPDLFGWGPEGKVIGGYNFIQEDQLPIDTNGHGTKVAGIIAADGNVLGVAPKAKILAYKVSEDGEGVSSELIKDSFGSFADFKEKFTSTTAVIQGSGWGWLVYNPSTSKVEYKSMPNQTSPRTEGLVPLLGCDVWEHAYYLNYQNKRPVYIAAWWNVVNWDEVEDRFSKAK